jgi:tRNA dimethylallyltransferase
MIIVVCGPTGVGKTKMSVELAKKYNAIILNADSMQVYKGLDIGTAKVTEEEKCGVVHELFDIVGVNDMYTVFDYQRDLRRKLDEYKDKNIIIVGGTGLYIKAGLYNYEFEIEEEQNNYDDLTNEELLSLVKKIDPDTDIHVNNRKRLIRRLNKKSIYNNKNELLYPATFIGLTTNRETLYDRINKRVDIMVEQGLIDEVKNIVKKYSEYPTAMQALGYKEIKEYLDGKISKEEAIEKVKHETRKYAKRQLTWFRKNKQTIWIDALNNKEENINIILEEIN